MMKQGRCPEFLFLPCKMRIVVLYINIYPDTGALSAPAVGGAPPGGGKDHWNDDTIAGRVKLRFELSEDVSVDLMGHGHRIEQGENPYQEISTIAVCDEQGRIVETLIAEPDEIRTAIGPGGANYRSDFYTNVNNFAANGIDDSIEGNANISYSANGGKWSLTFFINNIANARNETIKFDLATLCGCNEVAYIKPRWFGGSLRYNF